MTRAALLLIALAACTDRTIAPPDDDPGSGAGPDVECDRREPPGLVHVRAHPGDRVVVGAEDASLYGEAPAGDTGAVDVMAPACGSITAITADGARLFTVLYVAPGETIAPWGTGAPALPEPQLVTVTLPAVDGATSYAASAGGRCSVTGAVPTLMLPVDDSCVAPDGTLAIAGAALFADSVSTRETAVLRVALADALATPHDLGPETATAIRTIDVTDFTAVPETDIVAALAGIADGRAYVPVEAREVLVGAEVAVAIGAPLGDGAVLATVTETAPGGGVRRVVQRLEMPVPSAIVVASQRDLMTPISAPTVFGASAGQSVLSWSASTFDRPALGVASLRIAGAFPRVWRVAFPGSVLVVTLPMLPGDLQVDATDAIASVGLAELSGVVNWRAARVGAVWARPPRTTIPAGFRESVTYIGDDVADLLVR